MKAGAKADFGHVRDYLSELGIQGAVHVVPLGDALHEARRADAQRRRGDRRRREVAAYVAAGLT